MYLTEKVYKQKEFTILKGVSNGILDFYRIRGVSDDRSDCKQFGLRITVQRTGKEIRDFQFDDGKLRKGSRDIALSLVEEVSRGGRSNGIRQ